MKTIFLRALEAEDKASALRAAIREPEAACGRQRFEVERAAFAAVPRSPFAYWVSDSLRKLFKDLPTFDAVGGKAKQGMATADDFRWVRVWWESLPGENGDAYPVPFAKGGAFSSFYADLPLAVRWGKDGGWIKKWKADQLRVGAITANNSKCWNENYYFKPGLTWPIKNRFSLKPWPLPAGCVFAQVGASAFVEGDGAERLAALQAVMSSSAFTALLRIMAGWNFEVGLIQNTPFPRVNHADQSTLAKLARRAWSLKRMLDTRSETSHAFTLPALVQATGDTLASRANTWTERVRTSEAKIIEIQADIDARCFDLYGIAEADQRSIADGFGTAVDEASEATDQDMEVDTEPDEDTTNSIDAVVLSAQLVAWAVGVAFGRFDVRLATGSRPLAPEPEPFDRLPVCSPAMLTGDDSLPLSNPPNGYRVAFPESGILVDDPSQALDLTAAVRAVFAEVFNTSSDARWNEAAALLDPQGCELRAWLSSSFFEHHLKSYSKSRRKAPIFWQLSLPSGRYSVWLYAHRLTRDSFFRLQNDVLTPKLAHEERQLTNLLQSAGGNLSPRERKEISAQEILVDELRALLDEVNRVAPLWDPTLDDGIVLTMAPLWRLVNQHMPWQKELKSKWDELVAGKYDWAHIAMHLWPERVVPKCATDRSLAIAHGLEDVFWDEGSDGRSKPRQVPVRAADELLRERTSSAVKAALKTLLEAPVANAAGSRSRRRGQVPG